VDNAESESLISLVNLLDAYVAIPTQVTWVPADFCSPTARASSAGMTLAWVAGRGRPKHPQK